MPLRDHFHPPLSKRRHWENLHSGWANALRDQLNDDLLPHGYFAEVQISVGTQMEIDVATFEEDARDAAETGGVAVWAPPQPPQTALLNFTPPDIFEVQVFSEEEGPRLVASVELVSPANKDRLGHRHAFAVKCGSYLHQGMGLVVVDVVTNRRRSLHTELLGLLGVTTEPSAPPVPDLYANAYRTLPLKEGLKLEYWTEPLAVGAALPTVPLWISREHCLPLNLEHAYEAVCASSRIK